MQQLRTTILAEQQIIASKRRFGLFSQPPPLTLGDNSMFVTKKAQKGQDGKPKTGPRQLLAGQNRTGVGKKSFIQVPQSIYQKDPYTDTFKQEIQYQNKLHSKSPMHENDFKPGSGFKTLMSSAYKYVQQKQHKQKKIKRDDNGRVKTQPANIITNPISRVQDKFFKIPEYKIDPFQRPDEIRKKQIQQWRKKIKHENMFKSMSISGNVFVKDKIQYGIDDKTKSLMQNYKLKKFSNPNRVNHQNQFKLTGKNANDPIGKYPAYIPPRQRAATQASQSKVRKLKTQNDEQKRQDWKPTSGNLSRPTPSISFMSKNIRRYI